MIHFRDDDLIKGPIYYHQDYYNEFFSLRKKWKVKDYYKQGYAEERRYQLEPVAS